MRKKRSFARFVFRFCTFRFCDYTSVHTIVTHKKNIFRKLEINNVYEATRYALRAGLVEMADYYI